MNNTKHDLSQMSTEQAISHLVSNISDIGIWELKAALESYTPESRAKYFSFRIKVLNALFKDNNDKKIKTFTERTDELDKEYE